jgi:guanosine-3',5'-bis(diphosphate) 3'-pyrophosphohydrolase
MAHPTDEILRAMHSPTGKDADIIRDAYDFAEKAHGEEKRKSGEPYIIHPRAIAITLAKLGMDRDTIVAGILHDTIEDTPVKLEEIEKRYGTNVAAMVEGVTKLSKLKYRGVERHVESMRRLLVATANDVRVIIIKLADRLHNMETLQYVPEEKRTRIALETREVYVPIAERLGMGLIKAQLEDLAFKNLEPEKYKETAAFLGLEGQKAQSALDQAVKDLRKSLAEAGIKNFRTESRIKNAHSFAAKLERKENDIDRVYDIFALRVIVPNSDDCYKTLGLVHSLWRPIPGRVKDYIASPKPNGYRSIHTTILTPQKIILEVQIRSEEMQKESKFGIASHFAYKDGPTDNKASLGWALQFIPSLMRVMRGSANQGNAPLPRWLSELNEAANVFREQTSFQKALKEDFFAARMFVFTPKGDVIDLPVGATPVDFAYNIHSDIGDTMVGAKVNGKLVQLSTELKNGDIVEIATKKNAHPNKKWIDFAKTSSAKHHIRNTLNRLEIK